MIFKVNFVNETKDFDSFVEAFRWLYGKMKEDLPATYQVLETMIWIEVIEGTTTFTVINWYDARDLAYEIGLMDNGELTNNPDTTLSMELLDRQQARTEAAVVQEQADIYHAFGQILEDVKKILTEEEYAKVTAGLTTGEDNETPNLLDIG